MSSAPVSACGGSGRLVLPVAGLASTALQDVPFSTLHWSNSELEKSWLNAKGLEVSRPQLCGCWSLRDGDCGPDTTLWRGEDSMAGCPGSGGGCDSDVPPITLTPSGEWGTRGLCRPPPEDLLGCPVLCHHDQPLWVQQKLPPEAQPGMASGPWKETRRGGPHLFIGKGVGAGDWAKYLFLSKEGRVLDSLPSQLPASGPCLPLWVTQAFRRILTFPPPKFKTKALRKL